jgi:SAM-dependent methyltransferase
MSSKDMADLSKITCGLTMSQPGFWTCGEHVDMGFLAEDSTDWVEVEEKSFWYRHRSRCIVATVQKYRPNGMLFEIGAGNGAVTLALQQAGMPVIAVEPTVKWAQAARKRGVEEVVCATMEGAKFNPGSLSNVGMFDVLEHIPDDELFLRNVRALMPVGGRFYCAVPAHQYLWSKEDDAAGHCRRYTVKSLSDKIVASGFRMEFSTYYFVSLMLPILFLRAIPSRLGIRGGRTAESSQREHCLPAGPVATMLGRALDWEFRTLTSGGRHSFGASCLVVATAV